jgi:hypothetical protein
MNVSVPSPVFIGRNKANVAEAGKFPIYVTGWNRQWATELRVSDSICRSGSMQCVVRDRLNFCRTRCNDEQGPSQARLSAHSGQ